MLLFAGLGLSMWSCAQPGTLTGGPRDEVPPTVSRTEPTAATLNYAGQSVKLIFSEPIRKPTFGKEIFISPLVKTPKIVQSDNGRRIRILFDEPLRPETTYLITLKEIKDLTESNEIEEAFILAFSTGDILDSMQIKGRIESPAFGQPAKDMTVLLFDADSVSGYDFFGLRPAYLTTADDQGNFEFRYLRNTTYKIFGVKDGDQSNTYSQPNELVAISQDSLFNFPTDSSDLGTVKLFSFVPDDLPPRLLSYDWAQDSILRIRFSENLRLDSVRISISDTLHQDSVELDQFIWMRRSDPELYLSMTRPLDSISDLRFTFAADSQFNRLDTVLRIDKFDLEEEEEPFFRKPKLDIEKNAWYMPLIRPLRMGEDSLIALSDTARYDSTRRFFPLEIEREGFTTYFRTDSAKPDVPYLLRVSGQILSVTDSVMRDSTFGPLKLTWFDPESLGSINGSIVLDSSYLGPIVFQLINPSSQVERELRDTTFDFKLLPEGNYSVRIIFDADSNGVWTPGSLLDGRLPERIYNHSEPMTIKANWAFDDFKIEVNTKQATAASGKGAGPKSGKPGAAPGESKPGAAGSRTPGGKGRG